MVAQKYQPMREGQPGFLRGEASERSGKVRQVTAASEKSNSITTALMEEVVRRENLTAALKRVRANKGSSGVDGMTIEELGGYLREQWLWIREELIRGIINLNR
jgi:RNA-directed DNA polymerase